MFAIDRVTLLHEICHAAAVLGCGCTQVEICWADDEGTWETKPRWPFEPHHDTEARGMIAGLLVPSKASDTDHAAFQNHPQGQEILDDLVLEVLPVVKAIPEATLAAMQAELEQTGKIVLWPRRLQ